MAKLFIGIAAAFMLATAVVSFMLKGKVDALQTGYKGAKSQIANAEGQAKAAKGEADKAKAEAKDATEKLTGVQEKADAATKAADDAKKDLDSTKIVLQETQKKLDDAMTNAKPGPDPAAQAKIAELTAQVTDLTTQRDNATKQLAEKDQIIATEQEKAKSGEDELQKLKALERSRDSKLGHAGLHARILAVNGGWNFVVLSVGDKQGISIEDPLIVVRNGEPVARLRVTSVEPSTSIADVLPSSVRRGVTVQPGDSVIFQGRTSATQVESKPAAEPPATGTPPATSTPALPPAGAQPPL